MTHQPQRIVPPTTPRRARGLALVGASILSLGLAACGAGQSSQPTTTTNVAAASTSTTTTTPASPPHLRIVSPRHGAHTKQTLTVRLSLTGAKAGGQRAFTYILGGRLTRLGSARLTFHGLAAGHQHLVVALASHRTVKASVSFTVMAPPPPPAPAPAASTPATMAPAPMNPPSTMQTTPAPMTPPSTMQGAPTK
jgi:hypothetical protein